MNIRGVRVYLAVVGGCVIANPAGGLACPFPVTPANPESLLRLAAPLELPITDGFGPRLHPLLNTMRPHDGVDFDAPVGHPIKAAAGGRVTVAQYKGEFGNRVEIDHGGGWATTYGHMKRFGPDLEAGACVEPGAVLGYVGMTGLTAQPHLHFEVSRNGVALDPAPLLPK